MGQIKWYKRDPGAALNGMMELTLEERGAYNTVLDLIYDRDGNLPDDERFIAGFLRVDVRVWKRIKSSLIDRRKIYIEDGFIRNSRADVEVLAALSRVASASDAGRASAASKASKSDMKSSKNRNMRTTPVGTGDATGVSTNHNHNQNLSSNEDRSPPPPKPKSKDKSGPKAKPQSGLPWHGIPDWIPLDAWHRFLASRRDARKPVTINAAILLIGKLETLMADGHPPGAVLDQSTERGWTGLFAIDAPRRSNHDQPSRQHHDDLPSDPLARAAVERQANRAAGLG